MTTARTHDRRGLSTLLREATHPISDVAAWNRLLQRVNPLWSASETRARVVRRVAENDELFSLWLKPNRHWSGHQAGQHVLLGAEISGVIRRRVFSLSSAPGPGGNDPGLLRLSIQRQPGNGMTQWLFDHAQAGMVFDLSAADGGFVLPTPTPDKLLMIAGGSGITPMMAMLHQLAEQRFGGDIVLLQLFRKADQRLFRQELAELETRLPGLTVRGHESSIQGRLAASRIADLVADLRERHTLLCGPEGLISEVSGAWETLNPTGPLQLERFAAPRPTAAPGQSQRITANLSKQVFTQNAGNTLLEAAESAGLTPRFGCRAGLCRTCLCKKHSGTVRNLLTGLVSSQPDEWIQLCVSVAENDLELTL
ncbi:MAG: ferredoxin reductase [Wenzhouxiangella sp.]